MDVLRLAGAPGVGKSTVAWAVAERLASDGVPTGYLDIDQLGMCYPAPSDDRDRWALKETALARLAVRFRDAGVKRLVVSGVADPSQPPPVNGHPTLSLWLDADEETRRRRLAPRRWEREQVDAALAAGTEEASAAHPAWERLDTERSTIEESVQAVIARPAVGAEVASDVVFFEAHATGRVIWITGPRCAGASPVGWELARTQWAGGERTGFLDGAQLSFVWNADPVDGAAAAAVLQAVFAEVGAKTVIAVAPFEISPKDVHAAFPRADVRFFRLDADDRTRRGHAVRRAEGADGAVLAGDDLIGADADAIERILAVGARQRASPLRIGEILVDMPTSAVTQVVDRVRELAGLAALPD
ncbi:hypothetical protein HCX50_10595 [Microbacterium oxydans]|uniref:AAA family ATPase n=1 Tax=Microbacterium sp. B19(2022) TaxID=2914045 RepID=UPI00142F870A|nr:AAA family ATPase [Microbacterium sp. B19(2022)]NJI59875.1 hypothetical protein [Microbacterium sp. B19(2022)]